ncbi:unnamed protein product [Allacma fusca]|uniref:Histone RNA hairpin-binding protein RNA-binding domain-containing protein n=1 Tax=Allacma fusca TaxID=39272 RepID=A0A8J2JDS0_9HEXA|nr:unnamed protein product [Allacma fusca]
MNTQAHANYLKSIPIGQRGPCHPKTSPMHRKYSRLAWDGLVKRWRLNLHYWTIGLTLKEVAQRVKNKGDISHITFASTFYLFGDNLDETKLFIPPGHTRANRLSYNPKYPSQFRDSNNYRDSQISPGHRSGQIETVPVVLTFK